MKVGKFDALFGEFCLTENTIEEQAEIIRKQAATVKTLTFQIDEMECFKLEQSKSS